MDEDSIVGRATFAWITHRLEEGYHGTHDMGVHAQTNVKFNGDFGGMPVIYSLGDYHQLTPAGDTPLYSSDAQKNLVSLEACGNIAFSSFLRPHTNDGTTGISLPLSWMEKFTNVVLFLGLIHKMRDGELD
jgi:hypothetical protein